MADDARLAELREQILTALEVAGPMTPYMERLLIGELLPVVSAWAEQESARRAAEAERDRDELACHLDHVLYDLHPVYPSTTGPHGGIGGQAMTPWCHVNHPYSEEHDRLRAAADDALREQFRRAEREGYDLRARAAALTPATEEKL